MPKKIAVLVRDRQGEAMRMAVGITLMDDIIDVYVLDRKVEETEDNLLNLETMKEMDMHVYTNHKGNEGIEYLSTEEIAQRLLEYDHILPY
ncbi:MAG: hypothetical protein OHK0032_18280 [Thermodesulfovibrionales bacterium]